MVNTLTVDAPLSQVAVAPPGHGGSGTDPLAAGFYLPMVLTLEIPCLSFTVGSLMSLTVGSIVETAAQQNEDLTLSVNGQLLGTVEIEVTGENLAVRLTGIL